MKVRLSMNQRVCPSVDVIGLSTKIDGEAQKYLNDHSCQGQHVKNMAGDFSNIPNRIQFVYELTNNHLVRITVEEYV